MQLKNSLVGSIESIGKDFKLAWFTLLLVVVPSYILLLIIGKYPFVIDLLESSRATPWGVFTSIFVHNGFRNDFAPNAVFMALFVSLFVVTNLGVAPDLRRSRSRFFLYATFLSAIIANLTYIIFIQIPSFGASGAGYACEGVMLAFSFTNTLSLASTFRLLVNAMTSSERERLILASLMNPLIFALFIYWLVTNPESFLAVAPNIAVLAHGVGFYVAFLSTIVYHFLKERRQIFQNPQR
jgi:membrane associated rhomboid family serine protease